MTEGCAEVGEPEEKATVEGQARLEKTIEQIELMRGVADHLREQSEKHEVAGSAPVHAETAEDETMHDASEQRSDMKEFVQVIRKLERLGCRMTVRDGKDVLIMDLDEMNALKRRLAGVLRRDPETRHGLVPCTNGECERTHDTSECVYMFDGRLYDCDGGH